MLEVDNGIVSELEPIEIELPKESDRVKDDMDQFALNAGMSFPIVQVSKTVIRGKDIQSFLLKVGYDHPVPELRLVFTDSDNQFRETDYINSSTSVRVWLGHISADEPPINLAMTPTDVQVKGGSVIMTCMLTLPTEHIDIEHDTVQNMLKDFADQTKFGIKCNYTDVLSASVIRNYRDIIPIDFVRQFCEHIGIRWFIDTQYNVRMLDIKESIDKHRNKKNDILFFTTENLDKTEEVVYSNNMDKVTQFRFTQFGYDFIDRDNTVVNKQAVTFDKSFSVDIEKYQTIEEDFTEKPEILDTDCLYFEAPFDPYKLVGETFELDVWTSGGQAKRVTLEDYQNNDKATLKQQRIADVSGVYMLTNATYTYNAGSMSAWTSFEKIAEQQLI